MRQFGALDQVEDQVAPCFRACATDVEQHVRYAPIVSLRLRKIGGDHQLETLRRLHFRGQRFKTRMERHHILDDAADVGLDALQILRQVGAHLAHIGQVALQRERLAVAERVEEREARLLRQRARNAQCQCAHQVVRCLDRRLIATGHDHPGTATTDEGHRREHQRRVQLRIPRTPPHHVPWLARPRQASRRVTWRPLLPPRCLVVAEAAVMVLGE